ncbi:MAG TPA: pre-peptidase C-terminal domain-containing protein [Candidatus Binatia bacterium]|nr:pre-peptidase C-terminal domain-containing protein [Candidatus Binatia bacterium]
MPLSGQSNIVAGTYYLGVASEGQNPSYPYIGTGSSSFTLTSYGPLTVSNIGTLDNSGATDLLVTNTNEAGQFGAFQFIVPPGTLAVQLSLENRVGNPTMTLGADSQLPGGYDSYGNDGGQAYTWNSSTFINIANPAPTNYTLMVQSIASGGDASYRVRVHALVPQPVSFDGGFFTVSGQAAGAWQYFSITVPTNAFGWDIRLTNATSGNPYLYVCRDLLPSASNPNYWTPVSSTTWPSGYQWQAGYDWTGEYYDNNRAYRYGQVLQMGMGNPLQPGNYLVGVISTTGTSPINYTLLSRGIGTNLSIPILPLPFTNGVVSTNLLAREAAYYSVLVPTNLPTWRLRLATNSGDALLMLQKDALPNIGAGGQLPTSIGGGRKMQKPDNEQYLLMPFSGQSNIVAGTYYLAVASEGQNPSYPYLGSNSTTFSLTSYGSLSVSNIGTVDNTGVTDILVTNSLEAGQFNAYQFVVPSGTLSLAVSLENRVGNPTMILRADNQLPAGYDGYGNDGGASYTWNSTTLINIPNPAATNYTLMVQAIASGGDASYRLRLHALGPLPVAFDGGASSITNQAIGAWQYFVINVPTNALGWDIRISGATNGNPYLYVCRDQSPSQSNPNYWNPVSSTSWPSGYQWQAGYDWTGEYYDNNGVYRYAQVLQMGMGNPLQPGLYYVGVISSSGSTPFSYTLLSRGIGTNVTIPVVSLSFTNGVINNPGLIARDAAFYSIIVPSNVPDWKLRLANLSGECLLAVQKDALPNVGAGGQLPTSLGGGRKLQKAGNEQYLLLPASGQSNLVAGTYYLLVASEGVNPSYPYLGTNSSSFTLTSYGVEPVLNLGPVGVADLLNTNNLQGGENALYQFSIPPGLNAVEVRLDNVTGTPYMTLGTGSNVTSPYNSYGSDGGVGYSWSSPSLITLPNPTPTNYSLTVQANPSLDAISTVHIRQIPTPQLAFDASLNGPGVSNVVSGTLLNGQSAFFPVTVPTNVNGQPVFGWKLALSQSSGAAQIRVRQGALPDPSSTSTTPFVSTEAIIVPPFLTPGTWYVEVRGTGLTSYTLTSSNLQLKRPTWAMPVLGNPVTTTGLPPAGPLFGDSGVDTNGVALPGDQGIDLAQGDFDYYTVTVPPGNIGVLRSRLDAISGNPDLYIRVAAPSTLSHYLNGGSGPTLYDRNLSAASGSQYGNWVPINGRYEIYLTNATWFLAVQAAGNSNVRYRLRLYSGIVTNLALNGGSYTSQTLAAGDWLYYQVALPTNAPLNWNVTFSESIGNVVMYVRDGVPPGQGTSVTDYKDWASDNKNHSSAYASFSSPGTYSFHPPPVRPGATYYLGFRAVNDSTFSVSCNTNGGSIDYTNTVPFYAGTLNTVVPANSALKLRIDVPADARRLVINFTNVTPFYLYLDQGSVPIRDGTDPWSSLGQANPVLNQALYTANGWPWLPNYMYFLFITNTTGSATNFSFGVNGLNCATDDYDMDGLPDCWELTYWPSIYSYGPNDDPDGDGVSNLEEFLEGTDPTNPLSFHPRLRINAQNGTVNRNPFGTLTTNIPPKVWYTLGQPVQLTATPSAGYSFLGWSGDASGTANPLSVTMNGHSNITAIFGVTNPPTADYQFQNNLHSSVGNPPDLTNIAPGNVFVSDVVDGFPRTVYHFAQGSSVVLEPADGVIPTNIYTAVLLFRFDAVTGWRRILDVKNPVSDLGLYALNGALDFYNVTASGATTFAPSNYVQAVITRDASSNVVAYLNGVQQFSFVDSGNLATLAGSPQMLRFFKDDTTEDAPGAIARIRLYDKVMPPAQVASLDRVVAGPAPLQFVQPMYYSNHVMYLTLQVTPNFTYAIQASTNLHDWVTITNVTSATPLILISDPQAPNYADRFYRGVAQVVVATGPAVTTLAASGIQISNATINASINPNGAVTGFYFQYGTNASYGRFSPTNALPAGASPVLTNFTLAGLLPNTTYHFQAVATNSAGSGTGADLTFTTIARPAITNTVLQPGHQLALTLTGTPGISYTLESSTNLVNWTVRSNCVIAVNGVFQFLEINATNPPVRFYRLRWP